MIFAVPSHTQTPRLDGGETETDGLAQGCGIDMGDAILVADTAIRKIEPLAGNIAIGVGSIVGREPEERVSNFKERESARLHTKPVRRSALLCLKRL
jgi:hypothetical protein